MKVTGTIRRLFGPHFRGKAAVEMHQIRYFLAVCETLNFTRAAGACNVSQPSLTRAIKGLEDELGGPLFRRERNNTHLTSLGEMMRPHLTQVLIEIDAAKERAKSFAKLDWRRRRSKRGSCSRPGRALERPPTWTAEGPAVGGRLEPGADRPPPAGRLPGR